MPRPSTGQVLERRRADGTRVYALRFRAYGERRYITLGSSAEGWSRARAQEELANVMADVRRGLWQPAQVHPPPEAGGPVLEPTFHEFASEWFDHHRRSLQQSTVYAIEWRLSHVLLPFFAQHRLSEITVQEVDRYRQTQLRERDRLHELREAGKAMERRPLANTTINRTIALLAQILDVAVEYDLIDSNPARGRRRRLTANRPARAYLDSAAQMAALLAAAAELDNEARPDRKHVARRPLLATLVFAGLRIGELLELRWSDVNLASGWISVRDAKTPAGVRKVKIRPALREELASYKAGASHTGPKSFVFGTSQDQRQSSSNVRSRVLRRSIQRANERLELREATPLPTLTPHGLRRSFASLLYAIGEPPPVVMAELGHTDPGLALSIYAHAMRRDEDENDRLRALVNGHQWAPEQPSVPDLEATDRLDRGPDDAETRSASGFLETRPAGFEPATSASGGQRSIH